MTRFVRGRAARAARTALAALVAVAAAATARACAVARRFGRDADVAGYCPAATISDRR